MAMKWGAAGLAVAGLLLLSPKARKHIGDFLNSLAEAAERDKQRKEAERRAAELSAIMDQIKLSPPKTEPAPKSQVTPELVEPDARWRDVIISPSVVLVLGKRGSGKSALAYRLLELFRYRLTPFVVGAPPQAAKLLPEWIGIVPTVEDLPPDSIAVVDEAYIHFHSRVWRRRSRTYCRIVDSATGHAGRSFWSRT